MRGFTYVEKLIFIGSLALMLLIMVVILRWDARATRDAKRLADIAVMANWLEVGFHDSLQYPGTADNKSIAIGVGAGSQLCITKESVLVWQDGSQNCSGKAILPRAPRDPSYLGSTLGNICETQGKQCEYTYAATADGKNYNLYVSLEGAVGNITCASYPCVKTLSKDGIQ